MAMKMPKPRITSYNVCYTKLLRSNLRSFESVRDFITSATVTTFIDLPFALLFLLVIGIIAWPLVFPVLAAMILVTIYVV